ncbi:thioredoxin domain-containing protein [Vibrio ostreicida]|uniref:Thioredoxin domain-containing protein n=1 Tax=Vibrio ostreicida TaxID=526588 RepID=A0ABT8BX08_9VIBR|nr:thioredoxin domain-containing protein [Vibrio ostreicida]MDN3611566.1 thioredoxin domain-containing protein [Vibrio ostreicida]NPD09058.1 thioredoxin domain-containing protein [Vibrio ostreicida]
MKAIRVWFGLGMILLLASCTDGDLPQLGKHYQALPAGVSFETLPTVTEVFSLNCGHCKNMESWLPELESLTKQDIGKLHVTFNQSAQIGAIIYYAAQMQLGKKPDHAMMSELFNAVQMPGSPTEDDIKKAIDTAFDARQLRSPYQLSATQKAQLVEVMALPQDVTEQAQINAVPTFIVKGKYQVLLSGHQDIQGIANTISYLIQQP